MVTKADFAVFKDQIANQFTRHEQRYENQFSQFKQKMEHSFDQHVHEIKNQFSLFESSIDRKFIESEFRVQSRLGILFVSSLSVAVALLTWLIKI